MSLQQIELALDERDRDRAEYFAMMTTSFIASIAGAFGSKEAITDHFQMLNRIALGKDNDGR